MSRHSNGKWIDADRRLAIYLRDGCACVWCGASVEQGAQLTLDHVVCREHGGSHHASNLITACLGCNSRRGARTVQQFARAVAEYVNHGVTSRQILADIRRRTNLDLSTFRATAREIIARRGTAARALAAMVVPTTEN